MVTIDDYKAGNLTSVRLAFEHLGAAVQITDQPEALLEATRVVFPGVGAAGSAMATLRELGLLEAIRTVAARGTPSPRSAGRSSAPRPSRPASSPAPGR